MTLLSIIVPVFNKVNYIDGTIQSILSQSFTNYELILVNDGSTDGSDAKCEEYKNLDKRITVIHQLNGGVSSARNAGIAAANGDYIGFIDADDTIEPDMYELLIQNALRFDADISVCRMKVIFDDKLVTTSEQEEVHTYDNNQALSMCLKGELDRSANNKIYKSSIIKSIHFQGRIYEDILFTCKAFIVSQNTVFQNSVKYNYILRHNSTSLTKFNPAYGETIAVSSTIVDLVSQTRDPKLVLEAKAFDFLTNLSLLNLILLSNKNLYETEYKKVLGTLRSYSALLREPNWISQKHKVAYYLFFLNPGIYKYAMNLYCIFAKSDVLKRATHPQ
ncbi:glycosyltransferase [Dyadobacter fanqingshengii]|uniref:Glycosyltransferase n=1 Tax=Dyadobacter fanqingshengii TaxID=2906443 RepID=A0A9X1TB01_9BACT|nr:glycosyltransferase [Dyadobacter fanqingshengii]MCF0042003.1 glycosyltransferase [Dyadobacter fanqingshengii]MCF2504752.1 glycosyltransferase [Dyadobacter fanqingshengii]USJ36294.1 glycosyltransferase [Dyadobacter fanqingshengii]